MASISVYGYDTSMLAAQDAVYDGPLAPTRIIEGTQYHGLKDGSSACPILDLPSELRVQIYSYILPYTTHREGRGITWHRAIARLWSVSRQLYDECIPLLYGNVTFRIDVSFDRVEWRYQYVHRNQDPNLVMKTVPAFPDKIALRNRRFLRKFEVYLYFVDSYTGMIKYDYSNLAFLAGGMARQAQNLYDYLNTLPEIWELRILYYACDRVTPHTLPLVLKPFWGLRNVRSINVQGAELDSETEQARLQRHLQNTNA
ncbi:hypothetical protein MMC21_004027 [Puttea exsequens]|nr:hypothetical protein [Puttea exsequens]